MPLKVSERHCFKSYPILYTIFREISDLSEFGVHIQSVEIENEITASKWKRLQLYVIFSTKILRKQYSSSFRQKCGLFDYLPGAVRIKAICITDTTVGRHLLPVIHKVVWNGIVQCILVAELRIPESGKTCFLAIT